MREFVSCFFSDPGNQQALGYRDHRVNYCSAPKVISGRIEGLSRDFSLGLASGFERDPLSY